MYPNIADCLKNITFAPELIEKLIRAFITQWLLVLVLLIMWLDEVPHVSDAAHFLLYTTHRRCWVSRIAYILYFQYIVKYEPLDECFSPGVHLF